jgi:hypothetical protein
MALVVVFSNGRRRTYPDGVKVTVDSGALTLHQEKGVRMHHVSPSGWLEALETDKGVTEEEALKQIGHLPEGRQPEVHSWHEVPEE